MNSPTLLLSLLALLRTGHCRTFALNTPQLLTVDSTRCRHDTLVLESGTGTFSDVVPVLIGPGSLDQYALVLPHNGTFYMEEGGALAPGEADECAPTATLVSMSVGQPDCRFLSFHDPNAWRITPSNGAELPPLLHTDMVPSEYDDVELPPDMCVRLEIGRPVVVGRLVLDGREMSERALHSMLWSVEGQLTFRPGAKIARKVSLDGYDFMWPTRSEHLIGVAHGTQQRAASALGNLRASAEICSSHIVCGDERDLPCAGAITPADLVGAHCCPICGVLLRATVRPPTASGDRLHVVGIGAWRKQIGDLVNVLNAEHGAQLAFSAHRASEHELIYDIVVADTEDGFDRALLVKVADSIKHNFQPSNMHYAVPKISAEKPLPAAYPLLSAALGACAMATLVVLCLAWRRRGPDGSGLYGIVAGWKGSRRNLLPRMRYRDELNSESMQLQETGGAAPGDCGASGHSPHVDARRDVAQFRNPVFGDSDSMTGMEESRECTTY